MTDKIDEKLTVSDTPGEWVKDFRKSDAPQFKGKSAKKKQQMAIAAYLQARRESKNESVEVNENQTEHWKKVQSMDKGSLLTKDGMKKRVAHLKAVADYHTKYGNKMGAKQALDKAGKINNTLVRMGESVEKIDEKVIFSDKAGPGKGKRMGELSKTDHADARDWHLSRAKAKDDYHYKMMKAHHANAIGGSSMMHKEEVEQVDEKRSPEELEKRAMKRIWKDPHDEKSNKVADRQMKLAAKLRTKRDYPTAYKKSKPNLPEEVEQVDEASFANTMKKAIAAHERGDHKRAKYHLDNAKTARYAMKSTEISKNKDLLDKYKTLRGMHEEIEQIDEISSDTAKSYLDKVRFKQAKRAVKANMGAPREKQQAAAALDRTAKSMELARKRVKEEVEQLDEYKKGDVVYVNRMGTKVKYVVHEPRDVARRNPDSHVVLAKGDKHGTLSTHPKSNVMREETKLDEEVHDRYMRVHGKKASGHGRWAFTTSRHGESQPGQTLIHTGSFSDAHKAAKKHFGTKNVYVMEASYKIPSNYAAMMLKKKKAEAKKKAAETKKESYDPIQRSKEIARKDREDAASLRVSAQKKDTKTSTRKDYPLPKNYPTARNSHQFNRENFEQVDEAISKKVRDHLQATHGDKLSKMRGAELNAAIAKAKADLKSQSIAKKAEPAPKTTTKTSTGKTHSGSSDPADKHIIMQLRKKADYDDGHHDIRVSPTRSVKLHSKQIKKLVTAHDNLSKAEDKRRFRVGLIKRLRKM